MSEMTEKSILPTSFSREAQMVQSAETAAGEDHLLIEPWAAR